MLQAKMTGLMVNRHGKGTLAGLPNNGIGGEVRDIAAALSWDTGLAFSADCAPNVITLLVQDANRLRAEAENETAGQGQPSLLAMQKRWVELMQGARPTVDPTGKTTLEVIAEEVLEGKIAADFSDVSKSDDTESDAAD